MSPKPAIELFRERLKEELGGRSLDDAEVLITVKPLTPQEAIGNPQRRDYPIIKGKERVIEAVILGSKGQAFTDAPAGISARFGEILEMPLGTSRERAIFLATANAVLAHLRLVKGTIHCKDEEPEECATEVARKAKGLGLKRVGLIGLNPALAEALIKSFGQKNVRISDLNPDNIDKIISGVEIVNGRDQMAGLIRLSDLIIATGTTLANGTYDDIHDIIQSQGKRLILYGITAAGFCALMGVDRWCLKAG